jgi:hypothetical protein
LDDKRADPTAKESQCLRHAVGQNRPSVVQLLLADGRAIPTDAMLQHACYEIYVQILELLLDNPNHSLDAQTVNIRRVVFRHHGVIGHNDGVVLALIEYERVFTEEELLTMIPFCLDEPLEALLAIQPELFESEKVRRELAKHSKDGVLQSILNLI